MKVLEVVEMARRAKEAGSTRFCMGAAWRDVGETKDRRAFGSVLEMVRQVNAMGLEVCCTLGMLTADQAGQLKEAGLTAYNHNLDTSREFYPEVISTRSYDDRLQTIQNVRDAGISVCSGGILGLGEKDHDRVGLLYSLATMSEHPESVPINALVAIEGTPLGDKSKTSSDENPTGPPKPNPLHTPTALDMTRMIATTRVVMPRTMVRLSAGRMGFSEAEQAMMFYAGANSIFYGEQLLTTPNPETDRDKIMFSKLGLKGKAPHTAPLPPREFDDFEVAPEGDGDLSNVRVDKVKQKNRQAVAV
jgi:biotin synthase